MQVATVRVRDDRSPEGFKVINEADLNEFHVRWDGSEPVPPDPDHKHLMPGEVVTVDGVMDRGVVTVDEGGAVSIAKLPESANEPAYEIIDVLVQDMHEAAAAPEPAIPPDWASLHWKKQVKLAKELGFDGKPSPEQARSFLASSSTT